tara:strand:+ start:724 stop:903 length:180 start_codon:yes stop_codon:yes gene_type:complete
LNVGCAGGVLAVAAAPAVEGARGGALDPAAPSVDLPKARADPPAEVSAEACLLKKEKQN